MKKTMLIVLGVMGIIGFMGCQKKQVATPVEEPIVTEETTATALANLEMNTVNMSIPPVPEVIANTANSNLVIEPATSALEAASGAVEQNVNQLVENPTPLQIQEALKNAGYYDGKIDGSIGPKTKKAIEKFQTENGLKADGKVGRKTWSKLGVHLAANAVSSASSAVAPVTEPILTTENSEMPVSNEVK